MIIWMTNSIPDPQRVPVKPFSWVMLTSSRNKLLGFTEKFARDLVTVAVQRPLWPRAALRLAALSDQSSAGLVVKEKRWRGCNQVAFETTCSWQINSEHWLVLRFSSTEFPMVEAERTPESRHSFASTGWMREMPRLNPWMPPSNYGHSLQNLNLNNLPCAKISSKSYTKWPWCDEMVVPWSSLQFQ